MAEITAALVKELREKTGAGMMECKKALVENAGDIENAIDWLRKKGLSVAEKKAGRVASQGLVAVETNGTAGAVVELNSETDFVARNEEFQNFADMLAKTALSGADTVEALNATEVEGKTIENRLTDLIAKIGENMKLRRVAGLKGDRVVSYIHNKMTNTAGKIGVLVAFESDADAETLDELGKKLAMHVAASNPLFLDVDHVDPAALDREKAIYAEQARNSGKPEAIIEKMMTGRIHKYYDEVCFMEQAFVMDMDKKVKDVIAEVAKETGKNIRVTDYVRYALGEGIEKKTEDFAEEVSKQLSK